MIRILIRIVPGTVSALFLLILPEFCYGDVNPGRYALYLDAATVLTDVTFASCVQQCGEERGPGSAAVVRGIFGPPQIAEFEGECYCFDDHFLGAGVGDGESAEATYAIVEPCDGINTVQHS